MDMGAWWATVHGVTSVRHDWVTNTFSLHFLHGDDDDFDTSISLKKLSTQDTAKDSDFWKVKYMFLDLPLQS